MTNNVIPINITMHREFAIEDRAEIMAEILLDTRATLEVANEMLDHVAEKVGWNIKHRGKTRYAVIPQDDLDSHAPITCDLLTALKDPNSSLFPTTLSFSDRVAAKRGNQ